MADQILLPFDIWTNRAHCIMLQKQDIISVNCLEKILTGLGKLEKLFEEGDFALDPEKEDVHINVENFVTEDQGVDAGGRMHIGRSRNDQTACDMRLFLRSSCLKLFFAVKNLGFALRCRQKKTLRALCLDSHTTSLQWSHPGDTGSAHTYRDFAETSNGLHLHFP
ncbi:MAG: hypothetical protein CM1200mP30_23430 [Pseudomonadota bacterium]|nr:MAG: hypothetical protein CM1200mP30_23430 [Pseudomonadota bacterium]